MEERAEEAIAPFEIEASGDQLLIVKTVIRAVNTIIKRRKMGEGIYTFPQFFKDREKLSSMSSFTPEVARIVEKRYERAGWGKASFDFEKKEITLTE